jgi:hypothetical protein
MADLGATDELNKIFFCELQKKLVKTNVLKAVWHPVVPWGMPCHLGIALRTLP